MSLRLVHPIPQTQPLVLQLADCALSLADIWIRERDRGMRVSARHIVEQAQAEYQRTKEPLLHGCALLCGCVGRAIETDDAISDLWTEAAKAVAVSLRADAEKRAAN